MIRLSDFSDTLLIALYPLAEDVRLAQLATEEQSWRAAIDREEEVSPDLVPLIIVRVDPTGDYR